LASDDWIARARHALDARYARELADSVARRCRDPVEGAVLAST
jgi:hypothetical protein